MVKKRFENVIFICKNNLLNVYMVIPVQQILINLKTSLVLMLFSLIIHFQLLISFNYAIMQV